MLRWAIALSAGGAVALGAAAAEVRVLAASAFAPVLAAVAPGFEKRTGHKVVMAAAAPASIEKRIRDGEDFDLAILPPALLEALGKEGAVSDGSITALARVPAAGGQPATVIAGALASSAADANAAMSLLILLASEETLAVLKDKGLLAP
jgi:ABC-type molybdate transport system substrate-binding protein